MLTGFCCSSSRGLEGHRYSRLSASTLAGLLALSACVGSPADDIGNIGDVIGSALVCGFTNCKSSTDVASQDLAIRGDVRREGAEVSVNIGLGYRANLFTPVRLASPDEAWLMPGDARLQPIPQSLNGLEGRMASTRDFWTVRLRHGGSP